VTVVILSELLGLISFVDIWHTLVADRFSSPGQSSFWAPKNIRVTRSKVERNLALESYRLVSDILNTPPAFLFPLRRGEITISD
jgi:hypothetical protein